MNRQEALDFLVNRFVTWPVNPVTVTLYEPKGWKWVFHNGVDKWGLQSEKANEGTITEIEWTQRLGEEGWVFHASNQPHPVEGLVTVVTKCGHVHNAVSANDVVWDKVYRYLDLSVKIDETPQQLNHPRQERYTDDDGEDWIAKCAKEFTPEEFRGAMKFTIGKYLSRVGKKDSIVQEVTKIADYSNRWMEYEKKLLE